MSYTDKIAGLTDFVRYDVKRLIYSCVENEFILIL
jgi:hypothetical protein